MKNQYKLLFMVVLLLTGRMAVGQDTGPSGPAGNGGRTGGKPFVGVGISIRLQKLFRTKKVSPLPVPDKWKAMELSDSAVLPVVVTNQMVASPLLTDSSATLVKKSVGPVNTGRVWVNNNEPEYVEESAPSSPPPVRTIDLPVVTVTAPAPEGGGGPVAPPGPGPAFVPPSVGFPGDGGGGDGGGTIETDADGNPIPPCKGMLQRALNARNLQKQAASWVYVGAMVGCGYTGVTVLESTAVASGWLAVIPGVGPVALASLVAGTAIVYEAFCVSTVTSTYWAALASADSSYDQATLSIGPCP